MHKTTSYLTKRQIDYISREAKTLGIPVSELVRRIVDEWINVDAMYKTDFLSKTVVWQEFNAKTAGPRVW